jgi:hypothetical protein
MKWMILLLILMFLIGCSKSQIEEFDIDVEDAIEELVLEDNSEDVESYDVNYYKQESGVRVNLVRIEEVPKISEIKFTVVVEEIIGNAENRLPYLWFASLHSDTGKVFSLYQCGVERVDEAKWHASYCEKTDVLEAKIFEEKSDFIFTKQISDNLKGKFVRDIDKLPMTIIIEIDLSNKFSGKK